MTARISVENSVRPSFAAIYTDRGVKEDFKAPQVGKLESNTSPSRNKLHDPNITFEEYAYYAAISRAEERQLGGLESQPSKKGKFNFPNLMPFRSKEQYRSAVITSNTNSLTVSDEEWEQVARATRTATWGAMFFLITTDVFGPMSVPWALSQLGYVPGTFLYVIFGALAGYTGYQLWTMFLHLDSHRYPLKTYSDIAYRVYGPWARHLVNVLQSIQLFLSVGLLILANGQGISQLSSGVICFAVCNLIFTIAGLVVGQIRTIQRFKWLAALSIWINIAIMASTMAGAATYPPNFEAAFAESQVSPGPVITSIGVPKDRSLTDQVVGLMQGVYSYGGAMLYCEFMTEMKRPWDFWKAFVCAQTFITVFYIFYGLFVYSYQGQFSILVSNQGISMFALQTATNAMGIVSSLILACLYGNIGIKVFYSNVGVELFNFPDLNATTKGKYYFAALVPIYWALAFVICSAIPNITNFSALIASACVIQFTYTFPPILMIGFTAQKDAILPGEGFNAVTGETLRHDHGIKRWSRGLRKSFKANGFNAILFLGSLSLCILGVVASIQLLVLTFANNPSVTSFTCTSPIL